MAPAVVGRWRIGPPPLATMWRSQMGAPLWQEDMFCSSASSSAMKRRRHRGSERDLNALVAVVCVGDGRGLFGKIKPVTALLVTTQQCGGMDEGGQTYCGFSMETTPASAATPVVDAYCDEGDHRVFAAAMVARKMTARVVHQNPRPDCSS